MNTATLPLVSYQNPFALARYEANVKALSAAQSALREVEQALSPELRVVLGKADTRAATSKGLTLALAGAQYLLLTERGKPSCVRAYGNTSNGQDDAWRVWVVLSREVSDSLPPSDASDEQFDAFYAECGELWASWGMDASASPLEDYSPTGAMFQRSLSCYRSASGHVVMSQSGSRDV